MGIYIKLNARRGFSVDDFPLKLAAERTLLKLRCSGRRRYRRKCASETKFLTEMNALRKKSAECSFRWIRYHMRTNQSEMVICHMNNRGERSNAANRQDPS